MDDLSKSSERHFSGDPYLEPNNIHVKKDGTVVAYGPHGAEFELTESERATVRDINDGWLPGYRQQLAAWLEASRAEPTPQSDDSLQI
jgi:hypothetical protein